MEVYLRKFFKNKKRNYVLLAQALNTIIALISGKLIAIYVLPNDFGSYSIQWATYTFFSTLLISPFLQYIKTSYSDLLPIVGTKLYAITAGGILIITFLGLSLFLYFVYGITNNILLVILFLFLPLFLVNGVLSDFLNVKDKLVEFSQLSIIKALGSLIFISIYFVFGFAFLENIEALWAMQLTGVVICIIIFLPKYRIYNAKIKIAYATFFRRYIRFGWPLIVLAFWAWINNYFDRYAIEYFLSLKEVGVYNANYSVGSKFFLMISPVFSVLLTPFVYDNSKRAVKKKIINRFVLIYLFLSIPILLLIYYLRNIIGSLLLSQSYNQGFQIIFWIALAFFILTLTQLYELIFYTEHRTKVLLLGTIYSAIANIVLNIILIPVFGIHGAALATLIAFTIQLLFVFVQYKRL